MSSRTRNTFRFLEYVILQSMTCDEHRRRQSKVLSEKERLYTLYSEIDARPIMWLWEPYIPMGKVTLLQAESSETITSFLTGLLAEISKGGKTPDGNRFGRPYRIIYQSSIGSGIIRERLEMEGADCNEISFMDGIQPDLLEMYLDDLGTVMKKSRPRVVVIDIISAYSPETLRVGLVSLPRMKTVNQLIELAQENNCAIILSGLVKIRRKTGPEYERSFFDIDVLSAARSILQIDQKDDAQNIYTLRQIKNNLAPEGESIPFLIHSSGLIEWLCDRKEMEQVRLPRRTASDGPCEIDDLPLSRRLIRNLKRADIDSFEKILAIEDKAAFLRIRNIGEKGYMQIIEALEAREMDITHLK